MKLHSYLAEENLSQQAFADRIGTSQVAVNQYANGRRIPRREIMLRIVAVTGGKVTPSDFFDHTPKISVC